MHIEFVHQNIPNMTFLDQNAGVVDGFGESELEDLRLEATLQEVLDTETEHVIELHLVLRQHTDSHLKIRH